MTLTEKLAESLRDCIRSLNIAIEYNGKIGNPDALRKSVTRGEEALAEHRAAIAAVVATHDLYKDGDAGLPSSILDANGDVVLGLCKRCGRGEADLVEPCVAREQRATNSGTGPWADLIEAAKKAQAMMAIPERIEPRHRQELCEAIDRCEGITDPRRDGVGELK